MDKNSRPKMVSASLLSDERGQHARSRPKLPLSRRAKLSSDAFTAGNMVRFANDLLNDRVDAEYSRLSLIDEGIQLLERLHQWETYLESRPSLHLIAHPESADTVKYMKARGVLDLELTEQILSFLRRVKDIIGQGRFSEIGELDLTQAESTRAFFREVHTSLLDQLGVFGTPASPIDTI